MLNDIFAYRYKDTPIWETFGEPERRLLVQAFQIVSAQVCPYFQNKAIVLENKAKWEIIHDKLCRELGLQELSPKHRGYYTTLFGEPIPQVETYTMDKVCQNFVCAAYDAAISADRFMKERISFIELAFRGREEEMKEINAKFLHNLMLVDAFDNYGATLAPVFPGSRADGLKANNERLNKEFKEAVEELNVRFRRSRCGLHYHNGFIQQSSDELTKNQIEVPFWGLVAGEIWKNVDTDMKEAIDRRDNGDRDPAFYAGRALESTIKIISDKKNWTHGKERGAANFIENLLKGKLIEQWEMDALKHFFTKVRNPMAHGAGSDEMPKLNPSQTNWSIEFCMSWIKSLIKRV
ncbi:MAG: hypothetical protein WAN11_28850 [Syntrophobacteraceae bacterium]